MHGNDNKHSDDNDAIKKNLIYVCVGMAIANLCIFFFFYFFFSKFSEMNISYITLVMARNLVTVKNLPIRNWIKLSAPATYFTFNIILFECVEKWTMYVYSVQCTPDVIYTKLLFEISEFNMIVTDFFHFSFTKHSTRMRKMISIPF